MSLSSVAVDYTPRLRQLMAAAELSSLTALYEATGLPRRQIDRLRQGQVLSLPVGSLLALSQVFEISLAELLRLFDPEVGEIEEAATLTAAIPGTESTLTALKAEYQRLQMQHDQLRQQIEQDYQRQVLQILESLLLQWPTAAYAARQNPQAPAIKILPLLHPLQQLLQAWQVETIGAVGSELAYDPQCHQVMDGDVNPGESVRVRYVGYRQGTNLLYRARVSPIIN